MTEAQNIAVDLREVLMVSVVPPRLLFKNGTSAPISGYRRASDCRSHAGPCGSD